MYINMVLAAAQPEATNVVDLWQLIATIGIAVIGAFWVIMQLATKNKDKAQEKDLTILKQQLEGKINKERGSREKKEIEIINKILAQGKELLAQGKAQENINKELKDGFLQLKDLTETIHEDHKKEREWFTRWSDKINDSHLSIKDELNSFKEEIRSEATNVKKMVDKIKEKEEIHHKASEKTTQ